MPSKGQIVLFLRGDSPCAGAVDGAKGDRLLLVAPDGKRLQVQPGAILATGPTYSGRPKQAAREWTDRLLEKAAGIAVAEIWELLEGSGEMSISEVEQAWFGQGVEFEERAALLVALISERVHFSRKKDRIVPEPRQKVEQRLARIRDHERKAHRIETLASWLQDLEREPDVDEADRETFLRSLTELAVGGSEARGTAEAAEVLKQAGMSGEHAAFDLLVRMGRFSEDENLDLVRHQVRQEFPSQVEEQTREILASLEEGGWKQGREDATGLGAVTIDSASTVEVDDALSVRLVDEGWEVGVHIADVACLVEPGSALHEEAMARGATLYMPDRVIPMLPPGLGSGGFSLDPDVEKPAVSLFARISTAGEVLDFRFARTVLAVARRLDYSEATELAASGDGVVAPLVQAGRALKALRLEQGGIDLSLPELSVWLDEVGEVHVSVSRGATAAHVLVSECAILYNRLVGRLMGRAGLAGIYRTQPSPEAELPDTALGGPPAELEARRLLQPSAVTTEPGDHHTLGVSGYSQATSPIRRSFDLLMQRQVSGACGSAGDSLTKEELDGALLAAGPAVETVTQIERARIRYWLLRHLEGMRGSILTGVVVDHQSDRVLVHLPGYAMEIPLRTRDPSALRKGEEIEVRLDRSDARRDVVRISLVGGPAR
jgi:exoribonuclease-2